MPQDSKVKELIINQLTKEQYKQLKNSGQLSSTELYIITDNEYYTEDDILFLLNKKQDKLIVGEGINIEDNIISINLEDFYTSNMIDELLQDKSDISQTGTSLDYTDNILTLKNIYGIELSSIKIVYTPEIDNVTINLSNSNQLQSIGEITRNGIPKYTWIGSQEEYEQAKLNGAITEFTEVLIIDSEIETVAPIVKYEAPTKLSQLANDMDFIDNEYFKSAQSNLENKIKNSINDENLVHKDGTEILSGFKKFKEKIIIENDNTKGRIGHKNINSSLEDGYIEFGENTLIFGKQNIDGELFDDKSNIFHEKNIIAGKNINITQENGIYKINSELFDNSVYIVESYINGTSGYNIYSNNYCEQWGRINGYTTLTFLKPFINANYSISIVPLEDMNDKYRNAQVTNLTESNCFISFGNFNEYTYQVSWRACGYIV